MTVAGAVLAGSFFLSVQTGWADQEGPVTGAGQGNLIIENVPEIPPAIAGRVAEYRDLGASTFLDWAPDSKAILVGTRLNETEQLHLMTGARGKSHQVTFLSEPVTIGRFRPGTVDVLFASDVGGTEDYHLFYLSGTTGETRHLTPDGGRNTDAIFSDDGNTLVWSRSAPGASDRNIMMATAPNFDNAKVIFKAPGSWSATDFSPDGSSLILRHYVSSTIASLYVLHITSGKMTEVNPSERLQSYSGAEFSRDGSLIYFLTDADGEYNDLYSYNVATGEKRNLTGHINREIDNFDLSPDGKRLAFTINKNGASRFEVMEVRSGRALRVPRVPEGLVESFAFSPDSRRIAYTFSTSRSPGNVFTFKPGRRNIAKWTRTESTTVESKTFVEPEQVMYPTFDKVGGVRRQVPAYVYRPASKGPHPVVIYIHGGPAFQFRPRFYAVFQYWLNDLGIAVVAPNVRGSTGYGKTYRDLDNRRKREDSVKDIGALIDWLGTQEDFDADRIALYGGSYGGYMVLSSMMHYNDQLAGGVSVPVFRIL